MKTDAFIRPPEENASAPPAAMPGVDVTMLPIKRHPWTTVALV